MNKAGPTRTELSTALQRVNLELQAAQQELARVQEQVSALRRQAAQLQAEYDAALQQALTAEALTLHRRLDASAATWRTRATQLAEQARLSAELQALLERDAGLAAAVREYDDAIAQQSTLDRFPASLRDALKRTLVQQLAALEQRAAPYRALQQRQQEQTAAGAWTLTLACVVEDNQLWHWVTPWPADDGDGQQGAALLLGALSRLGRDVRWTIDDIDRSSWQGRLVYHVLGSFDGGSEAAPAVTAELLREALQQDGQPVTVVIERLSAELWRLNEAAAQPTDEAGEAGEAVTPTDDEEVPASAALSSDWFTAGDLRSWTRRSSKRMSPTQRRMRTLVVRLLGRGHIGDSGVSVSSLLDGLPDAHADGLRNDIALLRERRLLLAGNSTESVTLNPAQLEDYRALIVRDPGEIWATGG